MTVHFIGAGPGAADLLTLRAVALLGSCPVCLYAGSLVPPEVLGHCAPGTRFVDTAGLTLEDIVAEFVAADRAGHDVARLCSGDPSIFSALAEQIRRLDSAGLDYDITPGVPAFAAAAASLRRELTVPGLGQTVVLTRTSVQATPMPAREQLAELGALRATLVLHLSVRRVGSVLAELEPFYGPDCPVAIVANASRADEIIVRGTLADITPKVHAAAIERTAVIIVGAVLGAEDFCDSHLYSSQRERS
ncbi:MAG: precorrin-4 C(11)-methyltransferase [Actinomycetota bacterium]|nr:precorrin-4 C(11)-methyltransferase [Actinomycetota bacterium]